MYYVKCQTKQRNLHYYTLDGFFVSVKFVLCFNSVYAVPVQSKWINVQMNIYAINFYTFRFPVENSVRYRNVYGTNFNYLNLATITGL